MSTSRTRARFERTIDLYEAGYRIGYSSETLRHWINDKTRTDRPPFVKAAGRWKARLSEFDDWATEHGLRLYELPPEGSLQPRGPSVRRRRAS